MNHTSWVVASSLEVAGDLTLMSSSSKAKIALKRALLLPLTDRKQDLKAVNIVLIA